MKILLALCASLALALGTVTSAEGFGIGSGLKPGQSLIMMVNDPGVVGNESVLKYINKSANSPTKGWVNCSGLSDPKCDFDNKSNEFESQVIFPQCVNSTQIGCVQSLALAKQGEDFVEAKFIREATGGMKFPAENKVNFIEGSSGSLYEAQGLPNSAGANTYVAVVKGTQSLNHKTGKWSLWNLTAMILPYKELNDPKYGAIDVNGNGAGATNMCAFFESGVCGQTVDFAAGTQAKLTFRLPKAVGGWFRGRLNSPNIEVVSANAKSNLITVSGEPAVVPRLVKKMTYEELQESKFQWLDDPYGWGTEEGPAKGVRDNETRVYKFIDTFRDTVDDTATGANTYWSVSTMDAGSGSSCLSDTSKVLGIVVTNAMGYDGSAPAFKSGFLSYKVGGLHYLPDGSLAQGTYDLIMRSETARCLYGFSKAPLSATVSVVNEKGTKTTATTVVSEKNGWLKMAAYGFTFSKKTIKVKITKKKK